MDASLKNAEAIFAGDDPIALFGAWLAEAEQSEPNDPNAMCLATVDGFGFPDARMVLLKGHGEDGFVFYTNTESTKGLELTHHPLAALLFHWKSLRRQVRIRGTVAPTTPQEADAYFRTRHPLSQVGAAVSAQSRPLESRAVLEEGARGLMRGYEGGSLKRPEHWSGYRLTPLEIEFWRDGAYRLHDRFLFRREGTGWTRQRLYP